ncbi:LIM domain-binding protein 3 isoform X1 [Esox lucius]|uniref:PDZ domain-containing protein n=1 Tax=Esox lucius TaxID=8010 RepID=A0A3P9ACE5_ESOLU|nr:LIM domain-binding protein 3 isoform X1 [Esox lucius]
MSTYNITLSGPAPWGFRLQGGKDFNMPLTISRITPGSKAQQGNLVQGDVIVAIDGVSTEGMTHLEAQNKIKCASFNLALTMQKSKRPAHVPSVTPSFDSPMQQIAHQKGQATHINGGLSACNISSMPLEASGETNYYSGSPIKGQTPSSGSKTTQTKKTPYNTPIGLYSAEALQEMAQLQESCRRKGSVAGLSVGSLPVKNAKVDSASPVYQAVIKNAERDTEPNDWARSSSQVQSKSFRLLAHITGTEFMQDPDLEHLRKSRERFDSEFKGPRFAKLKSWHNGLSAQILNVPEKALV